MMIITLRTNDIASRVVRDRTKAPHLLQRAGFTLIEILIVISIVAILAAILFAAFSRARGIARTTVCQNNLHQIGVAMNLYVQEHDGHYPGASGWADVLLPYIKDKQVFVCPANDPSIYGPGAWFNLDYAYNDSRFTILRQGLRGRNESGSSYPSINWLCMDVESATPLFKLPDSCGLYARFDTMHSGGANYLFLDGHIKWLTPESMTKIECEYRQSVKS